VAAALGLDEDRGDRLTLSFMPFAAQATDFAGLKTTEEGFLSRLISPWGLAAAAAFVALLLLWRRRRAQETAETEDQEQEKAKPKAPDFFNVEKDETEMLEEQLGVYAESNPEDVAAIIMQWLEES
jgi:flagellar biosynthesis/type III secretory pathway M-ring protein FliF/YscJ